MDDLKQSIITSDVVSICKITAEQVCQNLTKQLIAFFIKEYCEFYINGFLHSLLFFHTRLQSIHKAILENKQKPYQSKVLRTSVCEMFVMLSQIPRKQVNYRNVKIKQVNTTNVPRNFSFRIGKQFIHSVEFLDNLKKYYYSDSSLDNYLHILIYHVMCSKDQNEILHILNVITSQVKTSISVNLFDNPILKDLKKEDNKYPQDVVFLLFYIIMELCSEEKLVWCKRIMNIYNFDYKKSNKNNRFNLLLLAYSICSCDTFSSTFVIHNKYCNAIVLECAMKIDFHYLQITETNSNISLYTKTLDSKELGKKNNNSEPTIESDSYVNLLFSSPQKNPKMSFYIDKIRNEYNNQMYSQTFSTKVISCKSTTRI